MPPLHSQPSSISLASTTSSYNQDHDSDPYGSDEHYHDTEDLINSGEALKRFQKGELLEIDQAWHRLVPAEAREALGDQEVQRQSVIFEIFKAEREYVADLEAIEDVYIKGLETASPPIIPPQHLQTFIDQVFGNLGTILAQHQRLLGELFSRQREQHPLVQSVADIILDGVLLTDFRSAYETYIKHYPLSESFHRTELKRNPAYQQFMQSVSNDPRIRKRDLITFISRPVTRLPRLNLVLEHILKLTDKQYGHPDLETLPIILGILGDFIKSTQPGIEAAESKVKFWALCEGLLYQKGEIILRRFLCLWKDMDLYDDSRSLVYSGPLTRSGRSDSGWSAQNMDLTGSLLDHYFLLTRDEKKPNGSVKRLVSRPLPLSYLRLGSFTNPPELQKVKSEDGRLRDSFRSATVTVYPFTIYHASSKSSRRYTFYVASEGIRKRWHSAFVSALGVHKARQDGNMVMKNGVFTFMNPIAIAAIQTAGSKVFNKFIIHTEGSLLSYSLDVVAQAALGQVQSSRTVTDTMERVAKADTTVVFFKHMQIGERQLIMYTAKRRLQSSLDLHVIEVTHAVHPSTSPQRNNSNHSHHKTSFKPFGEPGYVPRDAFDIVPLTKTAGVCLDKGIAIVDPTNITSTKFLVVPDLSEASTLLPVHDLKARLDGAKPLGLVPLSSARTRDNEILVIFDLVGFYVTRQGKPCRSAGFIKWESPATSFAHKGNHVFLISPQFIEIRNINTGSIVQVIEGEDIRLLHAGRGKEEALVAMRGSKDDKDGASEKIVELVETAELTIATPMSAVAASGPSVWDEWDM
ncbi:hypothetical protein DXG01_002202 [Tephrocybe rancida]|nr:hypothetical protein DXG01_002202 [Tephrocybe rancida]